MGRFIICAAAIAGLAPVDADAGEARADAGVWHKDYEKAKAVAKRLKRPLFVVFR